MDAAHCDGNKHGSLQDVFYAVNRAQYFEFPHANCDIYTNDQLANLYFKESGYGWHCRRVVAATTGFVCDLNALSHNSQFVNYVTAWMRLKFVAEQVEPMRYARYFMRGLIPANKTPKLPTELLELYKADSTEFYALVDRLANTIQMKWIDMMIQSHDDFKCKDDLDVLCAWINLELQTIRSSVLRCNPAMGCDPYEFPIRQFLEYQRELRRVLQDGAGVDGCVDM